MKELILPIAIVMNTSNAIMLERYRHIHIRVHFRVSKAFSVWNNIRLGDFLSINETGFVCFAYQHHHPLLAPLPRSKDKE